MPALGFSLVQDSGGLPSGICCAKKNTTGRGDLTVRMLLLELWEVVPS